MVGRLLFFWDNNFSGATFPFGVHLMRVLYHNTPHCIYQKNTFYDGRWNPKGFHGCTQQSDVEEAADDVFECF